MICAVNVEEIWRGVRPDEHDVIRRFLRGLRLVALGHAEGERAGTWRRDHAARGVTLHQADCFIAAAAVTAAAALATGNPSHFPMAEVEVDHWPVGQ
jgi:predicted nucleic acid-binding protein